MQDGFSIHIRQLLKHLHALDLTVSIDMEHSTINIEQAQRIIAACHGEGISCIPRPVSHSNDYIKPLLESGSDGILIQMVETSDEVKLIDLVKYPIGKRTYGVNRAHSCNPISEYIES